MQYCLDSKIGMYFISTFYAQWKHGNKCVGCFAGNYYPIESYFFESFPIVLLNIVVHVCDNSSDKEHKFGTCFHPQLLIF